MGKSIQDFREKLKALIMDDVYFYTVLIIVISALSFGLGRWSVQDTALVSPPSQIVLTEQSATVGAAQAKESPQSPDASTGTYVASKKGTKYHLPSCPGAKQMSDKNKVYFDSEEVAKAAGYSRAKNCEF